MTDVSSPRDASGSVDYNLGWKLWSDMVRYYPAAVHRRRIISEWTRPLQPSSVLDVGCGTGVLLQELKEVFPTARFAGVDFAHETMAANAGEMPWCRFDVLDIARASLPERFDLVVCSEVLEHVKDDDAGLANLAAMTGKHLMITVPTGPIFPLERSFGHLRHYELSSLVQRLEAHDLRAVRLMVWGYPWMTAFKRASNFRPRGTAAKFGGGTWGPAQRAFARALTLLFYLNWPSPRGPQLFVLASRNGQPP